MSEVAFVEHLVRKFENYARREDFADLVGPLLSRVKEKAVASTELGRAAAALVHRYFDMWNSGNRSEADVVLSRGYFDHAHPDVVGPGAVRALVGRFRAEYPSAQLTAEIVASGAEYALVQPTIRWSVGGLATPCKIALFRSASGQLVEQWSWSPPQRPQPGGSEPPFGLSQYF